MFMVASGAGGVHTATTFAKARSSSIDDLVASLVPLMMTPRIAAGSLPKHDTGTISDVRARGRLSVPSRPNGLGCLILLALATLLCYFLQCWASVDSANSPDMILLALAPPSFVFHTDTLAQAPCTTCSETLWTSVKTRALDFLGAELSGVGRSSSDLIRGLCGRAIYNRCRGSLAWRENVQHLFEQTPQPQSFLRTPGRVMGL
mmetsp:Transcript_32819/g.75023  ORF Transcript_32819/g.75023 Transcript_32819/m.75023 type:complete len:204 (-) Transcript_32819:184-795(-)